MESYTPVDEKNADTLPNEWGVIVVGAGVAGLRAAQVAAAAGNSVLVIDACERVGGRVATDWVEGFALDRGFQVVLTAYPELKSALTMDVLGLKSFVSGAWVYTGHQHFVPLYDPFRHPIKALGALRQSLSAPFITVGDIFQTLRLRWDSVSKPESACWQEDGLTTLAYLRQRGFSEAFIHAFWMPFLRGIFLDFDLSTPATLFRFVFRMFATGTAALPAAGIDALPKAMARSLPSAKFFLNMAVQSATATHVVLDNGQTLQAKSVIWAAPKSLNAVRQEAVPQTNHREEWRATTCVYYVAPKDPVNEAVLLLNGTGQGIINTVCVPTAVQPAYRTEGTVGHLVSVSLLGVHPNPCRMVENELAEWFGKDVVDSWRWLKTDVIPQALPVWDGKHPTIVRNEGEPIYCGDGTSYPSLNGALASGRLAFV